MGGSRERQILSGSTQNQILTIIIRVNCICPPEVWSIITFHPLKGINNCLPSENKLLKKKRKLTMYGKKIISLSINFEKLKIK